MGHKNKRSVMAVTVAIAVFLMSLQATAMQPSDGSTSSSDGSEASGMESFDGAPGDMGGNSGEAPGDMGSDSGGAPGDMGGNSGGAAGDMGGNSGGTPGDMGGGSGGAPGDMGGDAGGAPAGEMPSSADQYFEGEDAGAVEEGYKYVSTDYGASAVAATGCGTLSVGGEMEYYDAADIVGEVSDENTKATTEEYTGRYLGDGSVNGFIILGAEDGTDSSPGNGITVDSGTANITNMYIQTSGAVSAAVSGRYGIASLSSAVTAINDSFVIHTGATEATENVEEPGSNGGLLISGRGRANFSVGSSTTMYFNSKVVTEGWAAMSTDSANDLHFYSYNSEAYAENGGYGVYADSGCNDFLYATKLLSAEIGAIISNNGVVTVGSGADAEDVTVGLGGESLLSYNTGEVSKEGSVVAGGRNSVMMHAPSSNGSDEDMNHYTLNISNSTLVTSKELAGESTSADDLSSTRDYGEYYGEATGRWIDLVAGANLLVKSTHGAITLDNVTAESYSGVLLMTVPNSDSTSRYITVGNEGGDTDLYISDSTIKGDICQYDYQRDINVTITDSDYSGAVSKMNADTWEEMWTDVAGDEDCYWGSLNNDNYNTETHDVCITLENSTWIVTDITSIDSLTLDENSAIAAADGGSVSMSVDGKETEATPGVYEGEIVLTPSNTASVVSDTNIGAATDVSDDTAPAEGKIRGAAADVVLAVIAAIVIAALIVVCIVARRRKRGKEEA